MALLNINDLIQQYALRSGVLGQNGQMTAPAQAAPQTGLLQSPALGQALLNAASGLSLANQNGYGLGAGLALGAQAFGNTIKEEKDRQEKAQKEATQNQLAALKDIVALKTQQEELGLRMQAAALQRRAQQDALDARAQERAQAEARKQAVYASGDPNLIKAYEMFGDDAAQKIFIDGQTPKERKVINVDGIPYYEDTKQPVISNPVGGGADPEATVPGFDIVPGTTPTKQDAKDLKNANVAAENIRKLLADRQAIVDKNGRIFSGEQASRDLDTNTTLLQLQIKQAEQTGALDKGTIDVLEKTIVNPTIGVGDLLNPVRAGAKIWGGKDYTKSNVDILKNYIDTGVENQAKVRGYSQQAKKPDAQGGFKFIGVE